MIMLVVLLIGGIVLIVGSFLVGQSEGGIGIAWPLVLFYLGCLFAFVGIIGLLVRLLW